MIIILPKGSLSAVCRCYECTAEREMQAANELLRDWRISLIAAKHITTDEEALEARQRHEAVLLGLENQLFGDVYAGS